MCDPVSIAIGGTLVGGAVSAYGSYKAGQVQGQTADNNAKLADLAAKDALARGQNQEEVQRLKTWLQVGQLENRLGASGVDAQKGSALTAVASAEAIGELDAQTIKNDGAREAWGFKVQGVNFSNEANLAREEGNTRAATSLLGSVLSSVSTGVRGKGRQV